MLPRTLLGIVFGALLSSQRAAAGRELLTLAGVTASEAADVRARALLVVALGAFVARRLFIRGRPAVDVLLGMVLGFAGAGLARWSVGPLPEWLVAAAAFLCVLGLDRLPREPARLDTANKTPFPALAAIVLGGAAVALMFEGLARTVRLRGGGIELDDTLTGTTLLGCMTIGACILGPFLRSFGERRASGTDATPALALATLLGFIGLLSASSVAATGSMRALLARFDSTVIEEGTWLVDVIVACVVFLGPALAAGTAVYCLRRSLDFALLCVGAAAGTWLAPRILAIDPATLDLTELPSATRLLNAACGLGAFAMVACAFGYARHTPARVVAVVVALACALGTLVEPRAVPVQPLRAAPLARSAFSCDLDAGQLRVEHPRSGVQHVQLNGRAITPAVERGTLDARCLRSAWALLPEPTRSNGPRVLLVGQLTPGRALVMDELGARRVDRCAAWWRAMRGLEHVLFTGHADPPRGEVLDPVAARTGIADGEYDLVIVPPIVGEPPLVPHDVKVAAGTIVVLWLDTSNLVVRRAIERPIVLESDGLEFPTIGVVWGVEPGSNGPSFLSAGRARTPSAVEWMQVPAPDRPTASRTALARRLEGANAGGDWSLLTAGLAKHAEAQRQSSPYETEEQRIELDPEALDLLFTHALGAEPDAYTRALWNGVARVLAGKRDIERVFQFVEPLAQAWPPWVELEHVLARANIEELDPQSAIDRLAPFVTGPGPNPDVLATLAAAQEALEDYATAGATWARALALRPGDNSFERAHAIALFRAGDPRGRGLLEGILARAPADDTVAELLGARDR